jgi:bacteriorhodopsin
MDYNIELLYMLTLKNTAYFSFLVQILIGLLQIKGLFINLSPENAILTDILKLESFVQGVEAFFYYWLINNFDKKNTITQTRYFDWALTTPTMLLSSIMYFKFLENKDKKLSEPINFMEFIENNKGTITKILIYNWLMLAVGYFGEMGLIPKSIYIPIGFVFFILSFKEIYDNFAIHNDESKKLFYFIFIIWALYGVAAMLPFTQKNIMYNLLDIVSKNFYGIYIYKQVINYNN